MKTLYLNGKAFVVALALLVVGFVALVWYSIQHAETAVYRDTAEDLTLVSNLKAGLLQSALNDAEHHVRFLHDTPPIDAIVQALQGHRGAIEDNPDFLVWNSRLQRIFLAYAENNPMIAQIRYIAFADNGKELVRVDRKQSQVRLVKGSELQQKGQRDYVIAARKLQPNQVYFSNINLNREHGVIEQPPWPTYRVAQTVFDQEGNPFGMVVVNFNLQPVFDELLDSVPRGMAVFLLNTQGDFLLHPDAKRNFEFEFNAGLGWAESYAEQNQQIDDFPFTLVSSPSAPHPEFLALKRVITLPSGSQERQLTLISALQYADLQVRVQKYRFDFILMALAFSLIVLTILVLYWLFSKKSLDELAVRAQFNATIQGSKDLIFALNTQGQMLSCNQAALNVLGWVSSDVKNKRLSDFPSQLQSEGDSRDDLQSLTKAFITICQGGEVEPIIIRLKSAEETAEQPMGPLYFSVALSPIILQGEEINGVAIIMRDITDARQLQVYLQKANDTLSEKNEEMERFIYTVSHDLRSPLVSIGGFARGLLRDLGHQLDSKSEHRLQRILANVDHMSGLLNDLLTLSRLVKAPMEKSECDLDACIDQVRSTLAGSIESSGCEFKPPEPGAQVYANQKMLIQVLQNLVENAIKYRHPDRPPVVWVNCEQHDHMTLVEVVDNGVGIEEQFRDKVFQIFERLNVETADGSGVGLSIVKTVMDKHQGCVRLSSVFGEGSTFSLEFPKTPGL